MVTYGLSKNLKLILVDYHIQNFKYAKHIILSMFSMNTEKCYAWKTTYFFFIFLQLYNFSYGNTNTDQECITEKILRPKSSFTIFRSTKYAPQVAFGLHISMFIYIRYCYEGKMYNSWIMNCEVHLSHNVNS